MNCFLMDHCLYAPIDYIAFRFNKFLFNLFAAQFSRHTFHFPLVFVENWLILHSQIPNQFTAFFFVKFAMHDISGLNSFQFIGHYQAYSTRYRLHRCHLWNAIELLHCFIEIWVWSLLY